MASKHNDDTKSPVFVLASTRVVAFNIQRTTIHLAFSISVNSLNFDIS
ncbi:31584_t:CDS:1, partial [Racocetra persica]